MMTDKELTEECFLTKGEEAEAGRKWFGRRHEGKSYNKFQAEALLAKAIPIIKDSITVEE